MKHISKLLSALLILALLAIPASAGVQIRDVNILVNGNFEGGITGWVDSTNGTVSIQSGSVDGRGNNILRVARGPTNTVGYGRSTLSNVEIGKTYKVSINWRAKTNGDYGRILIGNGTTVTEQLTTDWSSYSTVVVASANTFIYIGANCVADGDWVEFDNVSITPYYGTVQNREVNLTSDGNMEKSGTTGYAPVNAATISKQPNTWNVEGNQVLRVVNNAVTNKAFTFSPIITVSTGERWRVTGKVKSSSATLRPVIYKITGATQTLFTGALSTDIQTFDFVFTPIESGYVAFYCAEASLSSDYCEWDDLSITRYYGTVQNRDTAIGTDLNFEKVGTSDFSVVFSNLSKEENDRGDEGEQFLRVEYNGGLGNAYANQVNLVVGVPYTITGYWRTGNASYMCRIVAYGVGGITIGTTTSTDWIPFRYSFTPNYATLGLGSTMIGGVGSYCDYDNISITRAY